MVDSKVHLIAAHPIPSSIIPANPALITNPFDEHVHAFVIWKFQLIINKPRAKAFNGI